MKIGIDLDNTIINYQTAFHEVIKKEKEFSTLNFNNKSDLKKKIINKTNGEYLWKKLQGQVYGKYIFTAKIMYGFERFLNICKIRNHEVFIVSHKTEFGHFDKSKIPLRKVAIEFLKKNNIFNKKLFNLKKKNIFFAKTRNEKIKIINGLNLDYFIDDLLVVLKSKLFKNNIKKILINNNDKKNNINNKIVSKNSWAEITSYVFKKINQSELEYYSSLFDLKNITKLKKINKGINSKVYELNLSNKKKFILKIYPQFTNNNNFLNRGKNEFNALNFLHSKKLTNLSLPMYRNKHLDINVFSFIEGSKNKSFDKENIENLINFVKNLKKISKITPFKKFNFASESSNNIIDSIKINEKRISKLKNFFFSKDFNQLIDKINNLNFLISKNIINSINLKKIQPIITNKYLILSPSDISLGNILTNKKKDYYIDFEYFGWDDPCKLISDLLWHPKNKISYKLAKNLYQNLLFFFKDDPDIKLRFSLLFNLYGMKWCLILLNVFTNSDPKTINKIMTKSPKINIYQNQINKCNRYINFIENDYYLKKLKINEA